MLPCGNLPDVSSSGHPDQPRRDQGLALPPRPASVSAARAFVRRQCGLAAVGKEKTETAVLLTSEIVTNAFLHGRSAARIVVTVDAGGLLVEVGDDNSRFPQVVDQDSGALDGRGLAIVEVLASSWGAHEEAPGKVVWFRLR